MEEGGASSTPSGPRASLTLPDPSPTTLVSMPQVNGPPLPPGAFAQQVLTAVTGHAPAAAASQFDALPGVVVEIIFAYLQPLFLLRVARQVSHSWLACLHSASLGEALWDPYWKGLCEERTHVMKKAMRESPTDRQRGEWDSAGLWSEADRSNVPNAYSFWAEETTFGQACGAQELFASHRLHALLDAWADRLSSMAPMKARELREFAKYVEVGVFVTMLNREDAVELDEDAEWDYGTDHFDDVLFQSWATVRFRSADEAIEFRVKYVYWENDEPDADPDDACFERFQSYVISFRKLSSPNQWRCLLEFKGASGTVIQEHRIEELKEDMDLQSFTMADTVILLILFGGIKPCLMGHNGGGLGREPCSVAVFSNFLGLYEEATKSPEGRALPEDPSAYPLRTYRHGDKGGIFKQREYSNRLAGIGDLAMRLQEGELDADFPQLFYEPKNGARFQVQSNATMKSSKRPARVGSHARAPDNLLLEIQSLRSDTAWM